MSSGIAYSEVEFVGVFFRLAEIARQILNVGLKAGRIAFRRDEIPNAPVHNILVISFDPNRLQCHFLM